MHSTNNENISTNIKLVYDIMPQYFPKHKCMEKWPSKEDLYCGKYFTHLKPPWLYKGYVLFMMLFLLDIFVKTLVFSLVRLN